MIKRLFTSGLLKALWGFSRRDVRPRLAEIISTQDFGVAIIAGVAMAWAGPKYLTGAPKAADLATGFIAYAAIALGFCVGGMTIALTLPDREFVKKLAKLQLDTKAGNGLSGLLFVFTWTAVIHWLAIVTLLVTLLFDGANTKSFLAGPTLPKRVIVGTITTLCTYALLQFLITVLTLAHVGLHYIHELRNEKPQPKP